MIKLVLTSSKVSVNIQVNFLFIELSNTTCVYSMWPMNWLIGTSSLQNLLLKKWSRRVNL